jgi:hypothetical protein
MLTKALVSPSPYLIGIASHAYSDTWAHQNFSGRYDSNNAVIGFPEIFIPNIGHADFGEQPDIVSLIWNDSRYDKQINNSLRFIEAARYIYNIYRHFLNKQSIKAAKCWNELEKMLIYCFGRPSTNLFTANQLRQHRIKKYKEIGYEEFKMSIIDYIEDDWLNSDKVADWTAFQDGIKYFLNHFNGFTDT